MIGYSASNKDSGVVMSRWLVRKAQEALFSAANEANIDLTLFHGQGGAFGRGGGRTEVLVRTGPDGARRGRLRITEAGELIKEKYGLRPIALRIFEQAFNALSLASTGAMAGECVEPQWREVMQKLGDDSGHCYRALVHDDPEFYEFFCQLTPIDVIERMQIGSRPSYRVERAGVAALRSIPWTHAWSQCRYMLPGWYGAGTALRTISEQFGADVLSNMYAHWYFFENLIDDIELALARADLGIACYYDELVEAKYRRFIPLMRAEYELTKAHVLKLKGCTKLLDGEPTVQRSVKLRSPYIDPMHLVQVDLLKRWRAGKREDRETLNAIQASITGISQALQGA
jgi:phosphoenolpyruvate carboxylase